MRTFHCDFSVIKLPKCNHQECVGVWSSSQGV